MALRIVDWDRCMVTMFELAGATPQFNSVAAHRFDYRVVDE